MSYTTRTTCRVCGSSALTPLFSLGEQFVSDFVDSPDRVGLRCPIELELCRECTLVQLKHTARQEFLYTRHYWYRSGVTDSMKKALRDVTQAAEDIADLQPGDVVLDIGSNDGTLLRSYTLPGLVTVGVEPAKNLAEEGCQGITLFINDFWSAEAFWRPFEEDAPSNQFSKPGVFPYAKVITACGMFYDLEDPGSFIGDVAKVLARDGVFIAQLMCLRNMLDLGDVGNFAHEHLEFYSLRSLGHLFDAHGLKITGLETNNVNGQSYRLYVQHEDHNGFEMPQHLRNNLLHAFADESDRMLDWPSTYKQFFARMEENKRKVVDFILREVQGGKRCWVYGSSTKGNVILQWYQLNHRMLLEQEPMTDDPIGLSFVGYDEHLLIEAAAERSPEKWGKYTVGTNIPIYSEEDFRKARPDYAIMLPYAFEQEFLQREVEWLIAGGKFIIPLPVPRVVGADPADLARRADWSPPDRPPLLICEAL